MVENIVKLEIVLELLVKSVKAVIQIEKNQLKPKKHNLNNENFRNRKRYSRCNLQS